MTKYTNTSRAVVALALAACLAACGGGGGDAGPAEPATNPQPVSKAVVMLYGDSVQFGWAPGMNVAAFAQPLVADIAQLEVSAQPGATAYNLATGNGVSLWPPGLLKVKRGDVIAVNFGINDTYGLDLYEDFLRDIVADAEAVGSRVILQTPNPVTDHLHGNVSERAQVMRRVAADTGAVLCDHEADSLRRGLQTDLLEGPVGAHPDAVQYAAMGELFAGCVRMALAH